jgi:hypothetical protein
MFTCVAFAAPTSAQTNASANKQIREAEITSIKAYCQELDDYAKRNPKPGRIFADVSSGSVERKSRWREFKSGEEREEIDDGDNLNENADIWSKDGAVVLVTCLFQSPSRDWAHHIRYYYRKDGSLAKIHAELGAFYGNMTVIRERFYGSKGMLLGSSQQFLDLETKKEKRPGADGEEFIDEPIPVYRTVKALPFYAALNMPAVKTK